jgi:multicomponent K+:H+ antiporter subunit E
VKRLFPHPLLWIGLFVMWLLLGGVVTSGNVLLGAVVATFGCWIVRTLAPDRPRPRRFGTMAAMLVTFVGDVIRSNIAVVRLILSGREPRSAFLQVPLELKDATGLTILSCIITATPGSAWIQYDSYRGIVTIHVLDVIDDADWIASLKSHYEQRLIEILE